VGIVADADWCLFFNKQHCISHEVENKIRSVRKAIEKVVKLHGEIKALQEKIPT
jgi:hypothetical protein